MKKMQNKLKQTIEGTGLGQESTIKLVSRFESLFPENEQISSAWNYVLENMDPNCLPEITHCTDVAMDTASLGKQILSNPKHASKFGFSQKKQEQLDGVILAALFHDVALGYDIDQLKQITGNNLLHRWDKNNNNPQDTDSYRGALILEKKVGDKTGLPDNSVEIAIDILKNHGNTKYPWQTLVEFGDSLAYINGDNYSRAVIESYLLKDHINSFKAGDVDESVLEREIDFWKDIGIKEYGSKLGTKVKWDHAKAQKRMNKKGFLLLNHVRDEMPEVYSRIKTRTESKNQRGFIYPDAWAIKNYKAALDVLVDNSGLPSNLTNKLSQAHGEASKLNKFYRGEQK